MAWLSPVGWVECNETQQSPNINGCSHQKIMATQAFGDILRREKLGTPFLFCNPDVELRDSTQLTETELLSF